MKPLIIRYGEFWQRTDLFEVTESGRVKWNEARGWFGKHPPLEGARGIYILYRGRTPIYIGKAIRKGDAIATRLHNHARRWYSHAWDNVSWYDFGETPNAIIEAVEALLIAHIPGTLNGALPGRHLGKCCYPGDDKNYAKNTLWQK